jgi:hypothetical protein
VIVPVWNEVDGYYLVDWGYYTQFKVDGSVATYNFFPFPRNNGTVNTEVAKLLQNGITDNQLKMEARLSWVTDQGTVTQKLEYRADQVIDVYTENSNLEASGWKFLLKVTGYENFSKVNVNAAVVSGLGSEDVSSQRLIKP